MTDFLQLVKRLRELTKGYCMMPSMFNTQSLGEARKYDGIPEEVYSVVVARPRQWKNMRGYPERKRCLVCGELIDHGVGALVWCTWDYKRRSHRTYYVHHREEDCK